MTACHGPNHENTKDECTKRDRITKTRQTKARNGTHTVKRPHRFFRDFVVRAFMIAPIRFFSDPSLSTILEKNPKLVSHFARRSRLRGLEGLLAQLLTSFHAFEETTDGSDATPASASASTAAARFWGTGVQ